MLTLALCLLAAAAAPPAAASTGDGVVGAAGREAELHSTIEQLQKDMEKMAQRQHADMEKMAQRQHAVELELAEQHNPTAATAITLADPEGGTNDKLTAFLNGCKYVGKLYLGPLLLSDFMFYLSIVLVLQWHIRYHLSEPLFEHVYPRCNSWLPTCVRASSKDLTRRTTKPMMMLRKLGLNLMILAIYYDDDLGSFIHHRPFVCSMFLIFVDTVVTYYFWFIIGWYFTPRKADDKEYIDPLDETGDDGICPDKVEANNVYEDLTAKLRRVTPIWFVQMMLVVLYIQELNQNGDTKEEDKVDYIYWVVAVVFQMYAGDDAVGEAYNQRFWGRVLPGPSMTDYLNWLAEQYQGTGKEHKQPLLGEFEDLEAMNATVNKLCAGAGLGEQEEAMKSVLEDPTLEDWLMKKSFQSVGQIPHKVFHCITMLRRKEWQIRRFMDFSVNSVARNLILYTVPIMVCVEGPLDFVKDLTAVMFITMLDNSSDSKHIFEILVKVKFVAYSDDEDNNPKSNKYCMSLLEKRYAEEHEDAKFDRIHDLAADKWDAFKGEAKSMKELKAVLERPRCASPLGGA